MAAGSGAAYDFDNQIANEYEIGVENERSSIISSWGVNLYQDDVTDGVRQCYQEKRIHGKSNAEAIEELYLEYEPIISDTNDGPLFWFALADTLWEYGCLTKAIQEKAISHIPKDIRR
ncbi:MAG: hypothetical protein PUC41_07760 [Oscillospiraceae bacterium]|nr:hypothetical protein [Oscillospiraceae bacterium]